jgi:Na+-translocating ferredoxin:NAD+ oxidoreductase subunit C
MEAPRDSPEGRVTRTPRAFPGGIKPPEHKAESTRLPIQEAACPHTLIVPLHQHIGSTAKPLVKPGERVRKGEIIGAAQGYVSACVHAPTSGVVRAVDMQPVPHPSGFSDLCVTIEADGEDQWMELDPLDWRNLDPNALRQRLREAGIVGLGGAVFPSFIKLTPGSATPIQTLILNGAECEPYITCDDMLMRERSLEIVAGIEVMRHMLGASEVLIGIEDNKPEAIAAMREAIRQAEQLYDVIGIPSIYPAGGEKQLILTLTGQEVPSDGRPHDIGIACFNVATALSVHRAVAFGEPVISRIVTIAGNVAEPCNFEARIGTPVRELMAIAKQKDDTDGWIMGGPMMGFKLATAEAPVTKAMNCVLAASPALFPAPFPELPCIRCGRCAQVCPVNLQPMELYWFARARDFGKTQEYALFDCIECGCCSYVCPSRIPLVQYYRYAKSEIWNREKEKQAADLARSRYAFRQFRLQREKEEKPARLAQKTAAAKEEREAKTESDPKKATIAAAIARAREHLASVPIALPVETQPSPESNDEAELEAQRAKVREIARSGLNEKSDGR